MKKLFLSSLCLVSLSVFAQNKKNEVLTYKQGEGTGIFYIPAEKDFAEGQELFIKDKSRSNVGLTFFKTTTDTISYYVDIHSADEKGLVETLNTDVAAKTGVSLKFDNKCTEDNQPSFILNGSGQHIITLKRGNIARTYKLNLDLEK